MWDKAVSLRKFPMLLTRKKAVKTPPREEESAGSVSVYNRKRPLTNSKQVACPALIFTSVVGRSSHSHMGIAQGRRQVPVPR